jgi:hypothetical protein
MLLEANVKEKKDSFLIRESSTFEISQESDSATCLFSVYLLV